MGSVIFIVCCRCEMSPNKSTRLHKRSSKKKRADAQLVGVKTDPAPLERPSTSTVPASLLYPELQATSQEHLGFPDRTYLLASVIFQNVHPEKPPARKLVNYGNRRRLPLPAVKIKERQPSYELAFNTLKCKCELWMTGEMV